MLGEGLAIVIGAVLAMASGVVSTQMARKGEARNLRSARRSEAYLEILEIAESFRKHSEARLHNLSLDDIEKGTFDKETMPAPPVAAWVRINALSNLYATTEVKRAFRSFIENYEKLEEEWKVLNWDWTEIGPHFPAPRDNIDRLESTLRSYDSSVVVMAEVMSRELA